MLVEVVEVWKWFGDRPVLAGVSLSANRGEVIGVIGPNGCGKTTLLKIIAGLIQPDRGSVRVYGRVGFVLQNHPVLPWKKIRDNIALGLRYRGFDGDTVRKRVENVAKLLGIAEYLDMYPSQVSGGTLRKTVIAQMLVLDPDVLLLDEPFTGLDRASRRGLAGIVRRLVEGGRAVIIVDHYLEELIPVVDRLYVLTPPPARVEAVIELRGLKPRERIERVYRVLASVWGRTS